VYKCYSICPLILDNPPHRKKQLPLQMVHNGYMKITNFKT